jgi:cation diffusion facilitator CzcD-associated flavoprotein CzcO
VAFIAPAPPFFPAGVPLLAPCDPEHASANAAKKASAKARTEKFAELAEPITNTSASYHLFGSVGSSREPAFALWFRASLSRVSQPGVPAFDKKALRAKYRLERDKRLRPDGNAQYVRLAGQLSHYLEDPYTPLQAREPRRDHVTFAFIGGGFAGLVTGARLVEAGVRDVRVIEKGGDFGGTWYWNRYPGAQCDTASFVYMPLLEETGHMPSEKYAHAPEILEHCQRIGRKYGLYDGALFHTEVRGLSWDEAGRRWRIRTNRGDDFTAQFVGLGPGGLHVPKLPGIPGLESFRGHSFHTSRWDYEYTGGDPQGAPLDRLRDKRVAIIGTGATSVQCVPHLAASCKRLYVFQRTPSSVDVRGNTPTDREWFASIATPGWQQRWLENFTSMQGGGGATEDLVMDGWTDLTRRIRERIEQIPQSERNPHVMLKAWEEADFEKMEAIRARADAIVKDPATAAKLKAWYRQLCKRPCFHDEYLQAFNQPSTTLVDTDGKGVERISEHAVHAAGQAYEVDCIIYASGFEVGYSIGGNPGSVAAERIGFDPEGCNGVKLSDYWAEGMRTMHGVHVHGFPNFFLVQPTQGANLISNVPHNLVEAGRSIAMLVAHMRERGAARVELTRDAENAWVELLLSGPGRMLGSQDCTPGYYNNEGQDPGGAARYYVGYPAGATAYFKYLAGWRDSGSFEGLAFT